MIKEIKKKRTKFGSVISFVKDEEQLASMMKHNAVSAYAIAHRIGTSDDKGFGVLIVGHKNVPKLKNVVGHYISQIRGGELVVFMRPESALLGDGSAVYDHLDANRIERAYAMYIGSPDAPAAIVISSTLMEHLFHGIPDQLDMNGDWIGFIDGWLKKSLFGGRYFDGNSLVSLSTKESIPASEYKIEDVPIPVAAAPETIVVETVEAVVEKRKPGRPKTKK